jgi:hypothetical protein
LPAEEGMKDAAQISDEVLLVDPVGLYNTDIIFNLLS